MAHKRFDLTSLRKRHWLFIVSVFVLGPAFGFVLAADRGLLFGLAIAVFASAWLLGSQHEREQH